MHRYEGIRDSAWFILLSLVGVSAISSCGGLARPDFSTNDEVEGDGDGDDEKKGELGGSPGDGDGGSGGMQGDGGGDSGGTSGDGHLACVEGTTRSCAVSPLDLKGTCAAGTAACKDGKWQGCPEPKEADSCQPANDDNCNGTPNEGCEAHCSASTDCPSGDTCIGVTCQSRSDVLGPCDDDSDCLRGECLSSTCAVSVVAIHLRGEEVSGGNPPHAPLDGWYLSDETGRDLKRVSTIPAGLWLWGDINLNQSLDEAVPPNNYFVLLSEESSDPLTRDFEFKLSDGTTILKSVTADSSGSMVLNGGPGDSFKLFHWTGTDVIVLSKTY